MTRPLSTLTELARLGFADLDEVRAQLETLGIPFDDAEVFSLAADPDRALRSLATSGTESGCCGRSCRGRRVGRSRRTRRRRE